MTYILSSEDRRKLEEALELGRAYVEAMGARHVEAELAAALSLLAGLPKVQAPREPDEHPLEAICATCGKTYGDHIGPVCPNLARGRFALALAAMKEHPPT